MSKPSSSRIRAAVGLFFIAPLVAEYLLGDIPIKMIGALVLLAPLYGGGALLIREVARRLGRGWPTILVLAFAYAVFEEAFTTQTLFNPNYLHLNLHLLEAAYIPALGIGAWWTVFVLTLHTVWSMSTSIALAESLVPDRATEPWLGGFGLTVDIVLFTLASIGATVFEIKKDHFVASTPQFVISAMVCLTAILLALRLPPPSGEKKSGDAPSPWIVGAGALVAGSVFMIVPNRWAWAAVAIYVALDLAVIGGAMVLSRYTGWDGRHRLALAGGAAFTYAWHAFLQNPATGSAGTMLRIGNAIFAAALIVLLFFAARRTRKYSQDRIVSRS